MTVTQLRDLTDLPETHQSLVGDYDGSYTLGVVDDPPGFLLRVASKDISSFPRKISVRGLEVPVTVVGDTPGPVKLALQG
jgi:hypothetical protein